MKKTCFALKYEETFSQSNIIHFR